MGETLRILILEDRPADAEMALREVRKEGIEFTAVRVETEDDFRKQLQDFRPGMILADYSLAAYDGMSALAAVQEECLDVPFIFVSGTMGEDTAVESLHRGATDYILKERLSRLGAAVRRALLEAEKRRELIRTEEEIRDLSRFPSEDPYPVLRIARDGTLLYINEAGLSLLPQWHLEVGHASPPLLREAVFRSFDSGSTRMLDLEHGERVYSFVIAPTVAGRYANLYGRDVTQRSQTQESLRQSHDLLDQTGQLAKVGGWELDVETQALRWTREVYRIHEVDPVIQPSVAEAIQFYAPEARPLIAAAVQAAVDAGTPFDLELPLITARGRNIWVRAQGTAERRDGKAIRLFGAFQDITERKQAQDAESRLAAILEVTPDLVTIADSRGRLVYTNRAGRAMVGLDEQADITRYNIRKFLDAANAHVVLTEGVPTAVREGAWSGETELLALDGHSIAVSQVIVAHKNPDGTVAFVSTVAHDITERRRKEAALRESQAQLQLISENVVDLVAQISLDGTYVYVSPSFETVLGYPSQRLTGTSAFAPVHPEDLERVQAVFAEAMQKGAGRVEFRYRHADGRYVWVDTLGKAFVDEAGAPSGAVLSTRDVTERKQSEDHQRQSQERFETIFEEAPLGMALIDSLTGSICEANARFAEIAGRTRAEMTTIDWMSITHPDDVQEDLSNMAMMNAGKIPGFSMTKRYRRPDGSYVWINMTIAPLAAEDTSHPRHVCMIEDITDHRAADESRRLQSAALHAAADAIVITDCAGVIEWVNPAFTQLTGYTAEEALGKNPWDLLKSGKHTPAFYKDLWQTILSGRAWHGEMVNRRKDGSLYTEDQSVTPILDASVDAITHFVAIQEDITERLLLEAQFRQAQKMESVGQLASGIAHDFNNLLTVINGTAELVLGQVNDDDPVHADVLEIAHAGERAASLTRQLLAFSRQQILAPRVLNFNTVVAGMEGLLRRLLGEDIDLAVAPAPDLGNAEADPGQIEQVIANLAVNARDAMPAGGKLTIETRNIEIDGDYARRHGVTVVPGPYVLLVVSDSGVGMNEATRARVFEPFFTTKDQGKGTGLGLSTVYGIIKQSHGFIWVDSQVGHGTSFTICLPQVTEAASTDRSEPIAVSSSGTETILLVEDSAGLRKLAARVLEPAGYTVLAAATGEDALQLLERYEAPVHLVLSDVVLPALGGRELAERLARTRPEMKVLYMSGYTSDTIIRHGVLEGRVPFLPKPFTAAALLRKVREVLDSQA